MFRVLTTVPNPTSPVVVRVVSSVLAGISLIWFLHDLPLGVDSAVYRSGALAVLHGEALYRHLAATPAWSPDLPFAYPPVAALLFLPLAALPTQLAWGLVAVLSAFGLGLVIRLAGGAAWLLPVVLLLEPVWRTIGLGQVNVLLVVLVVVDVLALRGSRYSGLLIGLAAAVKLTPLIFVLHLVLTRRFADAGRAVGAFAGLTALGFVVLPGDAVRYWTSTVFAANDAMSNAWAGNQSLNGLVLRLTGPSTVLYGVLAVACVVGAAVLVRAATGRGDHVAALTVTALLGVLLSPISWTHHWVWVVLPCCLVVARLGRGALVGIVGWFCGWAFAVVPRGDDRELSWTPLEFLVGNGYVLAVLAAGVLALAQSVRTRRRVPDTRSCHTPQ